MISSAGELYESVTSYQLPQMENRESSIFHFVMIKPTHYDDAGYPIQWLRSAIPSNTLACINGLAGDIQRRQGLGASVELRLHAYETNQRVRPQAYHPHNPQGGGAGRLLAW